MDQAVFILGYAYLGLFFLIIVLDVILFHRAKGLQKRLEKKARSFYESALRYHPSMLKSDKERKKYLKRFCESLNSKSSLSAYSLMLKEWMKRDSLSCKSYLHELGPAFALLSTLYVGKRHLSKGYFAYFLSHYEIDISGKGNEETYEFLLSLTLDKSIYTRENAYRAIVRSEKPELLKKALIANKSSSITLNYRLLTETLLKYPPSLSKEVLSSLLPSFYLYSPNAEVGIINYMRQVSGDYRKASLSLLKKKGLDKEIKYSLLRYLKKYPLLEAAPYIIASGNESLKEKDYEMVSVIASVLSSYPCFDSGVFLLKALVSPSYLARRNAADSLLAIYPTHAMNLAKKMNDPYAIDMMKYRSENLSLSQVTSGEMFPEEEN